MDEVVVENDTEDDRVTGDCKSLAVQGMNDCKTAIVQADMCMFSFGDLPSHHVVEELESCRVAKDKAGEQRVKRMHSQTKVGE